MGGFFSLEQIVDWQHDSGNMTAKDAIDKAIGDIRRFFNDNPSKKRIIYSCASISDDTIGQGIFVIAKEVREYITTSIRNVDSDP